MNPPAGTFIGQGMPEGKYIPASNLFVPHLRTSVQSRISKRNVRFFQNKEACPEKYCRGVNIQSQLKIGSTVVTGRQTAMGTRRQEFQEPGGPPRVQLDNYPLNAKEAGSIKIPVHAFGNFVQSVAIPIFSTLRDTTREGIKNNFLAHCSSQDVLVKRAATHHRKRSEGSYKIFSCKQEGASRKKITFRNSLDFCTQLVPYQMCAVNRKLEKDQPTVKQEAEYLHNDAAMGFAPKGPLVIKHLKRGDRRSAIPVPGGIKQISIPREPYEKEKACAAEGVRGKRFSPTAKFIQMKKVDFMQNNPETNEFPLKKEEIGFKSELSPLSTEISNENDLIFSHSFM